MLAPLLRYAADCRTAAMAAILIAGMAPAAADPVAIAYCGKTGMAGIGSGATNASASGDAVTKCVANGGVPHCCRVEAESESGGPCIAVAEYPGYAVFSGYGGTANEAGNDALLKCGQSTCNVVAQTCP